MTKEVETIHAHFNRRATPEVWAEVDALRGRVAELEAMVAALRLTHAASADTHPKDGDVQQTPLVSGAVPEGQTP